MKSFYVFGIQLLLLMLLTLTVNSTNWIDITNYTLLPERIEADTTHAPFLLGVTSGDPMKDRVIIWTRYCPHFADETVEIKWEIAEDNAFSLIINSGSQTALPKNDWTVKVDADNLVAGQVYYYRFIAPDGRKSVTGRTKTAPGKEANRFRFASMSCSSIYSGFFNAYRRLGERDDIDLIVHLGDYIYDYPDRDEKVRVPKPIPGRPENLEEARERQRYYLLDPDLRFARQQHPWLITWDNHDVRFRNPDLDAAARQAFFEYLPIRPVETDEQHRIYRSYRFGDLFEIWMLDMTRYVVNQGENRTFLGEEQIQWLLEGLKNSTARWKFLGSPKMLGGWYSRRIPGSRHLPGNAVYFDPSSFDGHPEERLALLKYFEDHQIDNIITVSGDMHMTFAIDLTPYPHNHRKYRPRRGKGVVGVEIMTASISRGNFDEAGVSPFATEILRRLSNRANPHHVFTDFMQHGYGILDISPERVVAEMWYSPILEISDEEKFGVGIIVENGKNRWNRRLLRKPLEE